MRLWLLLALVVLALIVVGKMEGVMKFVKASSLWHRLLCRLGWHEWDWRAQRVDYWVYFVRCEHCGQWEWIDEG